MGGVTLREKQREYFYGQLDKTFPKIKKSILRLMEVTIFVIHGRIKF